MTDAGAETRAHIAAARDLLGPTPVRLDHVPRWFKKALHPYHRKLEMTYQRVQHAFATIGHGHALDHWGSTTLGDGRVAFVSEPYDVDAAVLAGCERLADEVGCVFYLDPNSWWFPGRTIRLVFVQRKDSAT